MRTAGNFPQSTRVDQQEEYALYRRGEAAAVTPGVRDAIGKAPHSFEAFRRDYAAMFS